MHAVLSVKELTAKIKGVMEGSFPYVWVQGQVSNISRPSSGHVYFTLKDADSAISAVLFKGSQLGMERFDPLTGEVYEDGPRHGMAFSMENGQEIIAAGRLTVYPARGVYQLVVEVVQEAGQGKLHTEFERLKGKLAAEGYFTLDRKRRMPINPLRVGIITSPGGAAIHDFIMVSRGRGLGGEMRVYPVPVQGNDAPEKIIAAFSLINKEAWAEVIVLLRGGGSIEDLWCFNDEKLAQTIFESALPVLAGIGHEVDFTLADLTADLRAATPSHAAQLLWTERHELFQRRDELEMSLYSAQSKFLEDLERHLQNLHKGVQWSSPMQTLDRWSESLMYAEKRLALLWRYALDRHDKQLVDMEARLKRFPEKTLARLERDELRLMSVLTRLERSGLDMLNMPENRFKMLSANLESLNPMRPLERGYAMVRRPDGVYLRSVNDATCGDSLNVVLSDGELAVTVD